MLNKPEIQALTLDTKAEMKVILTLQTTLNKNEIFLGYADFQGLINSNKWQVTCEFS